MIFKREMALENYRKENVPKLPSRLNCVYATTEEGISYWKNNLVDNDLEVFEIDVENEPFETNEQLLPRETLSYMGIYNSAYHYWNPNIKSKMKQTNEYLVQGRVKILKKVGEINRK